MRNILAAAAFARCGCAGAENIDESSDCSRANRNLLKNLALEQAANSFDYWPPRSSSVIRISRRNSSRGETHSAAIRSIMLPIRLAAKLYKQGGGGEYLSARLKADEEDNRAHALAVGRRTPIDLADCAIDMIAFRLFSTSWRRRQPIVRATVSRCQAQVLILRAGQQSAGLCSRRTVQCRARARAQPPLARRRKNLTCELWRWPPQAPQLSYIMQILQFPRT